MGFLEWKGAEVSKEVQDATMQNLWAAAVFLQNKLREKIARSNPPPYKNSSKEGEPPKKRTGNLQDGIQIKDNPAQLTIEVGLVENADYGVFLEFGTKRLGPRPWMRVTWDENEKFIALIASGGP